MGRGKGRHPEAEGRALHHAGSTPRRRACRAADRHSLGAADMSALICGSFAFDTIMVYQGYFKDAILPEKVHMLNVSFMVPKMRREFGGCAGNIAYNLKLLEGDGMPMGTVGHDFGPYAIW